MPAPLVLLKRLVLGVPLTPSQEDNNKTLIETYINGFQAQLTAALNADGTIKAGAVNTAAIQDRAVTLAKLAFLSSFYADDAGASNAMVITWTPALTAYAEGLVFYIKAIAANTGATTLKVDALAPVNVKKYSGPVLSALTAGDIVAGNIYVLAYDGTQFILCNPTAHFGTQDVFASSLDTLQSTLNLDLTLFLPAGQTWQRVEMFANNFLNSAAMNPVSVTCTLKWNCGTLLDTPVTIAPANGCGNSGQLFAVTGDNEAQFNTMFQGPVPAALATVSPLVVRATLLFAGDTTDTALNNWRFWAKATCSA